MIYWKTTKFYVHLPDTVTDFRLKCFKIMASKVDFFENNAIAAMQSDNAIFYAFEIIKVTSGFDLK